MMLHWIKNLFHIYIFSHLTSSQKSWVYHQCTIKGTFCVFLCSVQLHGVLRVVMEPLLGDMPLIGALSVFFLKKPVSTVTFDLMIWLFVVCRLRLFTSGEEVLCRRHGFKRVFSGRCVHRIHLDHRPRVGVSLCTEPHAPLITSSLQLALVFYQHIPSPRLLSSFLCWVFPPDLGFDDVYPPGMNQCFSLES